MRKDVIIHSNSFDEPIDLFATIFEATNPIGLIEIVHGMAEHRKRYFDFCEYLSENGYTVIVYDQRGHGETCGAVDKQGYMSDKDNFEILVEDVKIVNEKMKELYPGLDLYLLGHSMGSFVSQRYIEKYPDTIKGVILSGTNYCKSFLYKVGKILSKLIVKTHNRHHVSNLLDSMSFGSYNKAFKPTRTKFDWLSVNEENVDKYIADEYCGYKFTSSYFMDLICGFNKIAKEYKKVPTELPIYLFSGNDDPVGLNGNGVTKLYKTYKDKIKINDVSMKLYEGLRHEVLNEKSKEEAYLDVLNWIKNH